MYTFVDAVLKAKGKNTHYQPVNISLKTLKVIYDSYDDGHIELSNPTLSSDPIYVDYRTLRASNMPFQNMTFDNWLNYLGNRPFPTIPSAPVYSENVVLYSQASQADYVFRRVDPTAPLPNPYACHNENVTPPPSEALTDVMITKNNIDHDHLFDYCLFTINGFLHHKTKQETGVLLTDAGRTTALQTMNKVGILSFSKVGKLTEYPFNEDWINTIKQTSSYRHGLVIETGIDLTGKSLLCSIAGYLHGEDKMIDILSYKRGTIKLNVGRMEWIRRLLDAQDYIDLSPLGLSRSEIRRRAFSVEETRSDTFYYNLLKLSQSFLIVVDTPRLYLERVTINPSGINGLIDSPFEPAYPLYHHTGRFIEYWRTRENGKWLVHVDDSMYPEYLFETTTWLAGKAVEDGAEDHLHVVMHLLKIKNSLRDGA